MGHVIGIDLLLFDIYGIHTVVSIQYTNCRMSVRVLRTVPS